MHPTEDEIVEQYAAEGLPLPCPAITCGHSRCRILRSLAMCRCSFCAREIGIATPFVRKAAFLQHRGCVDRFTITALQERAVPEGWEVEPDGSVSTATDRLARAKQDHPSNHEGTQ